jgi:hypothetical protein
VFQGDVDAKGAVAKSNDMIASSFQSRLPAITTKWRSDPALLMLMKTAEQRLMSVPTRQQYETSCRCRTRQSPRYKRCCAMDVISPSILFFPRICLMPKYVSNLLAVALNPVQNSDDSAMHVC